MQYERRTSQTVNRERFITHGRLGFLGVTASEDSDLAVADREGICSSAPGLGQAITLAVALDDYIRLARERAKNKGKRATWAEDLESIKRIHLHEFLTWTLADLAASPLMVAAWYNRVSERRGQTIADRAARVIKTVYRRAARADPSLPVFDPTSRIQFVAKRGSQNTLDFADFPLWFAAWQNIESPINKAFQMINLLAGCRPSELSRLKWSDVLVRERCFCMRASDEEKNILVPMSRAIAREFKRARDAARLDRIASEWVFPMQSGGHITRFDRDCLPAWGPAFRSTWRNVAADRGLDDLIAHFCLGHIAFLMKRGRDRKPSRSELLAAQRLVSLRMLELMKGECSVVTQCGEAT